MHDDFTDQLDSLRESMIADERQLEAMIYQSARKAVLVQIGNRILSHVAQETAALNETIQALLPAPEPESYPRFMESQQPEPPPPARQQPHTNGYRPPWMSDYYEEVERLTRVPE